MKIVNEIATKIAFKNARVEVDKDNNIFVVEDDAKEGIIQSDLMQILDGYFGADRYDITITAKRPLED